MAKSQRRPPQIQSAEARGEESGNREISRLNKVFDAHWREWIHEGSATAESERLHLTEMAYALSDLRACAQEMRLDFLAYLLGMALQEALRELRAREPHD